MAIRNPSPAPRPAQRRGLTVDDWFALPDDGPRYELFDGVLQVMAPPNRRHQELSFRLARLLGDYIERKGGWAATAPIGVVLGEKNGYEPDLVYVRPERQAILSERGVDGSPDLVVEILSRTTRQKDLEEKLPAYLAAGVEEVWLVDPDSRITAVHWSDASAAVPFGDQIPSRIVEVGDGGLA